MRRRASILILVILAFGAAGVSEVRALTLADAEIVAAKYFPAAYQNCPDLQVEWGETRSPDHPNAIGLAFSDECRIAIEHKYFKHRLWQLLCLTVTHEFGHIAGSRFPDNPDDPVHSLDPDSIMYPTISLGHAYGVTGCLKAQRIYRATLDRLQRLNDEIRATKQHLAVTASSTSARIHAPAWMRHHRIDVESQLWCAEDQEWLTAQDDCPYRHW